MTTDDDIAARLAVLETETALLHRRVAAFNKDLSERIDQLATNRKFVLHADTGPASADQTLQRILEKLNDVRPFLLLRELRQLGINKNMMADAIELGVDRGVLVRGQIIQPRKGQRPMLICLKELDPRPSTGPAPDFFPIVWEDDPAPPATTEKRRPPTFTGTPIKRLAATVNPDTGRYNLSTKTALKGIDDSE